MGRHRRPLPIVTSQRGAEALFGIEERERTKARREAILDRVLRAVRSLISSFDCFSSSFLYPSSCFRGIIEVFFNLIPRWVIMIGFVIVVIPLTITMISSSFSGHRLCSSPNLGFMIGLGDC